MLLHPNLLLERMSVALQNGEGAYFIGSGISIPSGLPSWNKLLQPLLDPLGVELEKKDDLPLMSQHVVNHFLQNRGPLVNAFKTALGGKYNLNNYHKALRRTNINTIWTTNYDTLLEDTFAGSRIAVRHDDSDFTRAMNDYAVELIKIHGCINYTSQDRLVITTEDYEDFAIKRPATAERLRHDLLSKNFLFLGYGYRDPNISTILVEARRLAQRATREHYMVIVPDCDKITPEFRRLELWATDLLRVGIHCTFLENFNELEDLLNKLAIKSRGKTVFATGSHSTTKSIAEEVGGLLALENITLLDGQSDGIGRIVANAFGKTCVNKRFDLRKRRHYFPNPYSVNPSFASDLALIPLLKEWRSNLLRSTHTIMVFDGKDGTKAEVVLAKEMGCHIIPVPESSDGYANSLLKDPDIRANLDSYDAEYCTKAEAGILTAKDVVKCVIESLK